MRRRSSRGTPLGPRTNRRARRRSCTRPPFWTRPRRDHRAGAPQARQAWWSRAGWRRGRARTRSARCGDWCASCFRATRATERATRRVRDTARPRRTSSRTRTATTRTSHSASERARPSVPRPRATTRRALYISILQTSAASFLRKKEHTFLISLSLSLLSDSKFGAFEEV